MDDEDHVYGCNGQPKPKKTACVLKITHESGKVLFKDKYTCEEIERVVHDISAKNTARVIFYPSIDQQFIEEFELSSADIFRILREGKVTGYNVSPSKTELRVDMELNFRNSSAFRLTSYFNLKDTLFLADITII